MGADWNTRPPTPDLIRNHERLVARCHRLIERARAAWPKDGRILTRDAAIHEAMTEFWLFQTYTARFDSAIQAALEGRGGERVDFYPAFRADAEARDGY